MFRPSKKKPTFLVRISIKKRAGGRFFLLFMYGLLTKCEVKMAGYWPSSFFCVFMDRDEVSVHKLAPLSYALRSLIYNKEDQRVPDL